MNWLHVLTRACEQTQGIFAARREKLVLTASTPANLTRLDPFQSSIITIVTKVSLTLGSGVI